MAKKGTHKLAQYEKEAITLYKEGLSLQDLADKYEISLSSVHRFMKAHNIILRPAGKTNWTAERKSRHRKLLMGKPSGAKGKSWEIKHIKRYPTRTGEGNPMWKGGITPIHAQIRTSVEYKRWRLEVFRRDNFTCVFCGAKAKRGERTIHADHIKPFCDFPDLRLNVNNGRTLCDICHRKTDTWAGRHKFQKQIT